MFLEGDVAADRRRLLNLPVDSWETEWAARDRIVAVSKGKRSVDEDSPKAWMGWLGAGWLVQTLVPALSQKE